MPPISGSKRRPVGRASLPLHDLHQGREYEQHPHRQALAWRPRAAPTRPPGRRADNGPSVCDRQPCPGGGRARPPGLVGGQAADDAGCAAGRRPDPDHDAAAERAPEEAEAVSSECVELDRRLAGPVQRLAIPRVALRSARVMRSVVLMSRGRWREGIAGLVGEAELEPDPHYRIHIRQELALWLSRLGSASERSAALVHLTAAEEDSRQARCPRCARELTLRGAEVQARSGSGEAARRLLSEWDRAPGASDPADLLWRRHVAALVEIGEGLGLAGASQLEDLARRRREMGLLHDRFWALLDAGQALALAGGKGRRQAEVAAGRSGGGSDGCGHRAGARRAGAAATWGAYLEATSSGPRRAPNRAAEPAAASDCPPGRERSEQSRDRRGSVSLTENGGAARLQHLRPDRRPQPHRTGRPAGRRGGRLGRDLATQTRQGG